MSNTISQKYIKDYITENYGEVRHNIKSMAKACKTVAKLYNCTPKQIFHFIIENQPINYYTHSYGFHTAYGREIFEEFEIEYYGMYEKINVEPF